jgi:hypothetical protein
VVTGLARALEPGGGAAGTHHDSADTPREPAKVAPSAGDWRTLLSRARAALRAGRPDDAAELVARSAAALRAAPRPELGGWLPADEVAEARLVGAWLAAHEPPALELDARALEGECIARWARSVECRS